MTSLLYDDVEEMAALASTLVRECDVTVELGDYWPSADVRNRVIRLPDLHAVPSSERPRLARMLRGWFYHEVGHLLFTTLDYSQALRGQQLPEQTASTVVERAIHCHARWGHVFTHVALTVEDIRVDQLMVESRPGLARCMKELAQEENAPLAETLAQLGEASPLGRLTGALLLVGREVTTETQLPAEVTRLTDVLRPAFDVAVHSRTPEDVVAASEAMLSTLESLAERAARCSGLTAHAPTTEALDFLTDPSTTDGCSTRGERIGTMIAEVVAAATATVQIASDHTDDFDVSEDADLPRSYTVLSTDWDEFITFSQVERDALTSDFARDCRAARAAVGDLINVLAGTLALAASDEVLLGQDYGVMLDPSAYVRIQSGALTPDIWMDFRSSGALDAAVMLLVDCSGSMQRRDQNTGTASDELARICTTAMSLALQPAGIPHAVYGFTTVPEDPPQLLALAEMRSALGEDLSLYARTTMAARYYLFKTFETEDARGLAGIMGEDANLDGEAVALATATLRKRPESLKLLFVLSDGHPSGACHGPTEEAYLRQAVRDAERAGIRVIGIGIADDAVREYYPEWLVVYRLGELPRQLLTVLQQVLLER